MSYLERKHSELGGISDVTSAASKIIEDPCLVDVAKLVLQLNQMEQAAPSKGAQPSSPVKGIGLCSAVKPLNTIIALRKNKWILPAIGGAVFLGLFFAGYAAGKRGRL